MTLGINVALALVMDGEARRCRRHLARVTTDAI